MATHSILRRSFRSRSYGDGLIHSGKCQPPAKEEEKEGAVSMPLHREEEDESPFVGLLQVEAA
jgi:hypothetical protein